MGRGCPSDESFYESEETKTDGTEKKGWVVKEWI
jgi:hypothetical protein